MSEETPVSGGMSVQRILLHPSVEEYESVTMADGPLFRRSVIRTILLAVAGYLLSGAFLIGIEEVDLYREFDGEPVFYVGFLLCGPFIAGILMVLVIGLFTALSQGLARLLGGRGRMRHLFYLASGIWAPLAVVSVVAAVIPWLAYFIPFALIYGAVLMLLAVKAVHGFGRVRTAIAGGWLVLLSVASLVLAFYLMTGRG